MAAMSVGKLGKLDAICARLKLTQRTSGGTAGDSGDGVASTAATSVALAPSLNNNASGKHPASEVKNGDDGADHCNSEEKVAERIINGGGEKCPSEIVQDIDSSNGVKQGDEEAVSSALEIEVRAKDDGNDSSFSKPSPNSSNNNNSNIKDYNKEMLSSSMQNVIPDSPKTNADCIKEQPSPSMNNVESKATNGKDNDDIENHSKSVLSSVSSNSNLPSSPSSQTLNSSPSAQNSSDLLLELPFSKSPLLSKSSTTRAKSETPIVDPSSNDIEEESKEQSSRLDSIKHPKNGDVHPNSDESHRDIPSDEKSNLKSQILSEDNGLEQKMEISDETKTEGSSFDVNSKELENNPQRVKKCVSEGSPIKECKEDALISCITTSNSQLGTPPEAVVPLKSGDETIPSSTKAQGQPSPSPVTSTPSSSSGRRKSRKAAKPQKQVGGRYFMEVGNAQEEPMVFTVDDDDNDSKLTSESPQFASTRGKNDSTRKGESPLDLSGASNDQNGNDGYTSLGQIIENSILNHDSSKSPDHIQTPSLRKRSNASLESNSSPENSYANTLVDYAKNTMSELLGIYGFEGSDTRNLALGKAFPRKLMEMTVDKGQSQQPSLASASGDVKPVAGHQSPPDFSPDGAAAVPHMKSGPFRKQVYTSLTMPNARNVQNGHIIKAPSPPLPTPVLPSSSAAARSSSQVHQGLGGSGSSGAPSPSESNGGVVDRKNGVPIGAKRHYAVKTFSSSDFHKYIRRYGNGLDCGGEHCHDLGYRDHYHCLDCPTKVFIRKEEMVRHFKWHKKRQDSLQHGFMRYSPVDDCSKRFGSCTHNGRQTHYHCVQRGCDKVYISTSDVQMHANFHRKDSAIIQEGFQRFRATEDCGTTHCAFYGQRTTHFHCRRQQCNFTFKNKSDMEKHKSYHQKDEVLAKDGFKKFMKYEPCPFAGCRYSKVSNHIHCIRSGCQYVLHSTAQLYSHKRKHERREFESAYQRYNQVKQNAPSSSSSSSTPSFSPQDRNGSLGPDGIPPNFLLSEMLSKGPMHSRTRPEDGLTPDPRIMTVTDPERPHRNKALFPNKTMGHHPSSVLSQNERTVPENMSALNLTVKKDEKNNFLEDEKISMPLPLIGKGNAAYYELEEAQDLSVRSKQSENKIKQEVMETGFVKSEPMDIECSVKSQKHAGNAVNEDISTDERNIHEDNEFDDDDFDDDDDDDDDDKDYTQVEEPTLVNGFRGSTDEEKLDGSLSMSKEDIVVKGNVEDSERDDSDEPGLITRMKSDQLNETVELFHQLQRSSHVLQAPHVISNVDGQVMAVRMPARLSPDKRDESWKKYLVRYTANDACFSRCECLYKDHYHCRDENCHVTFKSKDGVRNHARYHEIQDSIVPLIFIKFDDRKDCKYENCSLNQKDAHYHCNWTNCNQVIPLNSPTFALLNHYRVHEFGVTFGTKGKTTVLTPQPNQVELDPLQKRRGRPPKYPKYDRPAVPKVHLTEKEILDSTLAFMHNKYSEDSTIINGFKKFESTDCCPDKNCIFQGSKHFHCGRKFCHMSTDRLDFLNLHAKDFHNNITILDGYEFFDRVVDCRRPHCHNNRINRHFHCIRPRCDYSFVRHSTMSQHNKKHPTATAAVLLSPPSTPNSSTAPTTPVSSKTPTKSSTPINYIPIAPASKISESPSSIDPINNPAMKVSKSPINTSINDSNNQEESSSSPESKMVIKSAGTFFPLSGIPNSKKSSISKSITSSVLSLSQTASPLQQSSSLVTSGTSLTTAIIQQPNSTLLAGDAAASMIPTMPAGAQIIKPGMVGMSIPANMIPASIPILAQTPNQPNILTGVVPITKLPQSVASTPQVLNIPGAQIIQTPQGQFLQTTGVIGTNMVQLIQNPVSVLNTTTASGAAMAIPTVVSNIANATSTPMSPKGQPLTILVHQPGIQQGIAATTVAAASTSNSPLSWAHLKKRMHYPIEANCGRPFCKLKKKDHYHCLDCNQAFSDHARLRVHIGKHGFKFKKSGQNVKMEDGASSPGFTYVQSQRADLTSPVSNKSVDKSEENEDTSENDKLSSSLNIQLSVFTDMVAKGKEAEAKDLNSKTSPRTNEKIKLVMSNVNSQWTIGKGESSSSSKPNRRGRSVEKMAGVSVDDCESDEDQPSLMIDDGLDESNDESSLNDSSSSLTLCSSLSRKSGRKRSSVKNEDFVNSETLVIPKAPKQRKLSGKRDSDLPTGYKRVRCGEDCGYIRCSYRQTVTHFHCLRSDCGYGFSDKSRIMQHSIRHDRLDKLMGGEFQQFRASVTCQKDDCEFDEKASHFHCVKCSFACTDSSKVPPHRKFHTKMDNISNNGFMKYSGTADCQTATCSYFRKQTHYHCLFPGCNHSVLGPSQMAPHKLKHS